MSRNLREFDTAKLLALCGRHVYHGGGVVVPEPYVPFIPRLPSGWNGILVVAIAQNLADTQREYREWLESLKPHDRWNRLNIDGSPLKGIGIGPWDDGTIKLCVAALRGAKAVDRIAVSNAILWSGRDGGAVELLSKQAGIASAEAWREMLHVTNPAEVIAFGSDAHKVMKKAGVPQDRLVCMPGPFVRKYSFSFRMDVGRLVSAFPEVARARADLAGRVELAHEAMAIHCACACVSLTLERGCTSVAV